MASNIQVQKITTLTGHRDCVYTLAPSGEEHIFFSAAGDGMVVAWDLNNPDTGELVAKVNAALANMKKDGRYTEIYKKWFGAEPKL